MTTTKAYDDLVEKLARERDDKLRGNISSIKMSPEETAKEIMEVTEGVFAEGATIGGSHELPNGTKITIEPQPIGIPGHGSGYVTKSGRVYKSKPGRKPKS